MERIKRRVEARASPKVVSFACYSIPLLPPLAAPIWRLTGEQDASQGRNEVQKLGNLESRGPGKCGNGTALAAGVGGSLFHSLLSNRARSIALSLPPPPPSPPNPPHPTQMCPYRTFIALRDSTPLKDPELAGTHPRASPGWCFPQVHIAPLFLAS